MHAVRSIYKNAPAVIPVPKEFQKKDIEVIFLLIENSDISELSGTIPDFPDRPPQV